MEEDKRTHKVLFVLVLCYLSSFVLMVTSIFTSSWYTAHPLAPMEQTSYGSLGLIEHCSTSKGTCMTRTRILTFDNIYWPYRPLQNRDFDTTLFLLIIATMCTTTAFGITVMLRSTSLNHKRILRWILLVLSFKSAALGLSAVLYIDNNVRSEQFRAGWSSYVAWMAVGISLFVNIPAIYLLRLKLTASTQTKLYDDVREENEYILTMHKDEQSHVEMFQYCDIHDVE